MSGVPNNHVKQEVLASLKQQLADYCRTIHNDINNRTPPIGKYLDVHGPNATIEMLDVYKRESFLSNIKYEDTPTFDEFYQKLSSVLSHITQADMDSIGLANETAAAKEFSECFDMLNKACFYNVNGKKINFWSGPEAKKEADENIDSLSNSNVPALAVIMQVAIISQDMAAHTVDKDIKQALTSISNNIFSGGSGVFAAQATDKVTVFMSAYNEKEKMAMVGGNFHWNAELPILQQKGVGIDVVFYDHQSKYDPSLSRWRTPVDFNDSQADAMINVVRRNAYMATENPKEASKLHDKNATAYAVRPYNETAEDRAKWVHEGEARTAISLHKLREVGEKWKNVVSTGHKEYQHDRQELLKLKAEFKEKQTLPMLAEDKKNYEDRIQGLVEKITNYIDRNVAANRKTVNKVEPDIQMEVSPLNKKMR